MSIFSQTSDTNDGLGFLKSGEEYWFRVAAVNANGQGPFSPIVRATPMALSSGNYHYGHMMRCYSELLAILAFISCN